MNVQRRDEEAAHQRKTRGEDAEGRGAALLKLYKLYQQGVALLHFFFLQRVSSPAAKFHPKADNRIVLR